MDRRVVRSGSGTAVTVDVRVELGDGPETVPVTGLSRAAWSAFLDEHDLDDDDAYAPDLIAACTGKTGVEAQEAWDEWPVDAAYTLLEGCLRASRPCFEWAHDRIREDGHLATELAVCAEQGISLTDFHARSVRDQDLALAQYVESRDTCPGCGMPSRTMKDPRLGKVTDHRCVHCQRLRAIGEDMPDEIKPYTHLIVSVVEPEEAS